MTATTAPQRNHGNLRNSPDGLGREKHCAICKEWWPADSEFYNRNNRNGLNYCCKACTTEVQREKRAERRAAAAAPSQTSPAA